VRRLKTAQAPCVVSSLVQGFGSGVSEFPIKTCEAGALQEMDGIFDDPELTEQVRHVGGNGGLL
jgi:hypothetical protein